MRADDQPASARSPAPPTALSAPRPAAARPRARPAAALAALAILLVLLTPGAASAHAILESTTPQRGATLREQPRQVVLRFSESVEGNFGAVRVFDAAAKRVDDGHTVHPGGTGSQLAVGLKPGLPDGTYVATYRVISADSHPVSGGLVFSIGAPGAAATPTVSDLIGDSGTGPVTQAAFGLARGLTYLATALVLGGLAFLLAVWLPALRSAAGAGEEWVAASSRLPAHGSPAAARRRSHGCRRRSGRHRPAGRDRRCDERLGGAEPEHRRRRAGHALRRGLGGARAGVRHPRRRHCVAASRRSRRLVHAEPASRRAGRGRRRRAEPAA